jgi:hypothetical protein
MKTKLYTRAIIYERRVYRDGTYTDWMPTNRVVFEPAYREIEYLHDMMSYGYRHHRLIICRWQMFDNGKREWVNLDGYHFTPQYSAFLEKNSIDR